MRRRLEIEPLHTPTTSQKPLGRISARPMSRLPQLAPGGEHLKILSSSLYKCRELNPKLSPAAGVNLSCELMYEYELLTGYMGISRYNPYIIP